MSKDMKAYRTALRWLAKSHDKVELAVSWRAANDIKDMITPEQWIGVRAVYEATVERIDRELDINYLTR